MNEKFKTPTYSFWPLLLAIAIGLIAVGVVSTIALSAVGMLMVFAAIIGWAWENRSEPPEEEA